jgi:hypothetical protein
VLNQPQVPKYHIDSLLMFYRERYG